MSFMWAYNPKYCDGDYCSKDCDTCRKWENSRAGRFRLAREERGLSQRQVAIKTGVSKSAICHLESDVYDDSDPKFSTVILLAKAYRVNPIWLMTGKEEL